jgi:glycosyltransferase involved in cell wall biosynthesis
MNFAIYENLGFINHIIDLLRSDGHKVTSNRLTNDTDVLIIEDISLMYNIIRKLKKIKEKKIKIINLINDIPPWRLEKSHSNNSTYKQFLQFLFDISHRNPHFYEILKQFESDINKGAIHKFFSNRVETFFKNTFHNRIYYQINYKRYLKYADLNLSISKYTQILVKKFLKINSDVCHIGVNSKYLLNIPKAKIKYDAINISRISPHKKQKIFVDAAKKLGLKFDVIGSYNKKKSVDIGVKPLSLPNFKDVFNLLNQSRFYVDTSEFEGFGMTPVEAAFLDKISIVSDTYLHREILGDYPLYFKLNNTEDLIRKMRIVMEGGFKLNNQEIKKKYSSEAFKCRLIKHIENLF